MQSNAEVKYMLKNCAWKEVTKIWAEELQEQLKCLVIIVIAMLPIGL